VEQTTTRPLPPPPPPPIVGGAGCRRGRIEETSMPAAWLRPSRHETANADGWRRRAKHTGSKGISVGWLSAPRNAGLQPFSKKSRTPTVAKEFQIGLCGVVEADLELFCNCWSAGFLGERLYGGSLLCGLWTMLSSSGHKSEEYYPINICLCAFSCETGDWNQLGREPTPIGLRAPFDGDPG